MTTNGMTTMKWSVALVFAASLWSFPVVAQDFAEVGVGTHVVVVDGEDGAQTGLGLGLRARFAYFLGFEFSGTNLDDSESVWGTSAYRFSLHLHAINTEYFNLYLAPGLAGDNIGDAFNPVGNTTWYRLGGGMEFRFLDGVGLGAEVHYTLPGATQIERYVDENGEQLLTNYLAELGPNTPIPTNASDVIGQLGVSDLLDLSPLDRVEVTIGLRYYF